MNLEFLRKSKEIREELNKQHNSNDSKINDLNYKIAVLNKSKKSEKVAMVFGLSILPWAFVIVGTYLLVKAGVNIPLEAFQISSIVIPATIGITLSNVLMKKIRIKEKLQEFSNAKTEKEKYEEKTRYEIELAKVKNKNNVIEKVSSKIKEKEDIIVDLSSEYDMSKKQDNELKEDYGKKLKDLEEKLDKITTKEIINYKFYNTFHKSDIVMDTISNGMVGLLISCCIWNMPALYAVALKMVPSSSSTIGTFFASCVVGLIGGAATKIKSNKDSEKIFDNINSELGEYAIDKTKKEDLSYDQREILANEKNKIIEELVNVRFHYEQENINSLIKENSYETKKNINANEYVRESKLEQDIKDEPKVYKLKK